VISQPAWAVVETKSAQRNASGADALRMERNSMTVSSPKMESIADIVCSARVRALGRNAYIDRYIDKVG